MTAEYPELSWKEIDDGLYQIGITACDRFKFLLPDGSMRRPDELTVPELCQFVDRLRHLAYLAGERDASIAAASDALDAGQ